MSNNKVTAVRFQIRLYHAHDKHSIEVRGYSTWRVEGCEENGKKGEGGSEKGVAFIITVIEE